MNDEHGSPRSEQGIGRTLKEAREEKGLTLQQVEQRTKIRARYLQAFEHENFDVLPAVYVLGSLKTYADFLGLDGAALSERLKASLGRPAKPDLPAQIAALEGMRDEDGEYEAAPPTAVGFDQLFLGMGVLLISILAVMTLVTALARGDESPISQLDEPSTPETPSEMALAANVENGAGPQPPRANGAKADEDTGKKGGERTETENKKEDEPEPAKAGEDSKDQETSLFGDAKFVPMSPSSPAAPSPSFSASAIAKPGDHSASSASVNDEVSSPAPPGDDRDTASVPSAPAAGGAADAPSQPGGRGASAPASTGGDDQDRTSAAIDRKIDQAFEEAGLGQ